VKNNGKDGLKTSMTGLIIKQKLLKQDFHITLMSNLMQIVNFSVLQVNLDQDFHLSQQIMLHSQSQEVKKNGNHGHKILMTGLMHKQKPPKLEFHINQSFN
jgi:hypothetical protein